MSSFQAVLFDYGHTLVDLRWDELTLIEGERQLLATLDAPPEALERFHADAGALLLAAEREAVDHAEVDYLAVTRAALARQRLEPDAEELSRAMRAQIRAWDSVRALHPDAHELLDRLRAGGIKVGYVSNTLDPPWILREVMADEGMAARADSIVLSSELGYRKPSPRIYRAATEELDVDPRRALFVGDRVLEDVVGPKREGMTAVLAEWFRDDEGDHTLADHRAGHPLDVLAIVDRGVLARS
jgi:putative hydrolase of the HAD superfamily